MMSSEAGKFEPVHLVTENPNGWLRATMSSNLDKLRQVAHLPTTQLRAVALALEQAKRWESATGQKPEDSSFTLIVPIHNEKRFLPSFLSSLAQVDIPTAVNAKILLVTNGCTDQSPQQVDSFMQRLGDLEEFKLSSNLGDSGLVLDATKTKVQNIEFIHLNTSTPSKANALSVGNKLAVANGHPISMSLDANNFPHPNAIRTMYATAYNEIVTSPTKVKVFSARPLWERKPSLMSTFTRKTQEPVLAQYSPRKVVGWFMAWDTNWLESIGGLPRVALEDYALGVRAWRAGYQAKVLEDVQVWGYAPNSLRELVSTRARNYRGKLQILEQDPLCVDVLREDDYLMRDFPQRLSFLLTKIAQSPTRTHRSVLNFLIGELGIYKALQDYKKDPSLQSWEPILSTK